MFKDSLPGVQLICKPEGLNVFLSEDKSELHKYSWIFDVRFKVWQDPFLKDKK